MAVRWWDLVCVCLQVTVLRSAALHMCYWQGQRGGKFCSSSTLQYFIRFISMSSCLIYLLFTCSIHRSCSCCRLSLQRSVRISRWCRGPSGWRSALRWKEKRRLLRLMASTHVYTRYVCVNCILQNTLQKNHVLHQDFALFSSKNICYTHKILVNLFLQ